VVFFNSNNKLYVKPFFCTAYCSKKMFAGGRDSSVPVPKCPRDTSALVPIWMIMANDRQRVIS